MADDDLGALLRLRPTGDGTFTNEPLARGHLYGGHAMALALRAACRTVDARLRPQSLHAVFPSPGDAGEPLRLEVRVIRDGRSSALRHVTAVQGRTTPLLLTASFHAGVPGPEWQAPLPDVPAPPEEIETDTSRLVGVDPVEFRPAGSARLDGGAPVMERAHPFWARSRVPLPAEPDLAAAVLVYVSDYMNVAAAQVPGTLPAAGSRVASLDHAMWFHRPVDAGDWLLYAAEPVSVAHGRGLVHGTVRDRRGTLVASYTQETLTLPPRG